MGEKSRRAALYLRVSRDEQTTQNQRLALERVAEHRGWQIVRTYEDQGCEFACNIDPLRGVFASNSDPL